LHTAVTVTVVVTGGFVAAARSARAKNETTEMRENMVEIVVVVKIAKSYLTEESEVQLPVLILHMGSVRPERNSRMRRIN
jgi:heme A synthase